MLCFFLLYRVGRDSLCLWEEHWEGHRGIQHPPIHTVLVQNIGLVCSPSADFWTTVSFSLFLSCLRHMSVKHFAQQGPTHDWALSEIGMLTLKRGTYDRDKITGEQNQQSLVSTNKGGISSAYEGRQANRLYMSQNQIAKFFEVFLFPWIQEIKEWHIYKASIS